MEDQSRNIDTLLMEELGNITETPPLSVWVSLEARLDERKRRRVFWFWPLIFIVMIGSSVIGYKTWQSNQPTALPGPVKTGSKTAAPETETAPEPVLPDHNKNTVDSSGQQEGQSKGKIPALKKPISEHGRTAPATNSDNPATDTRQYNSAAKPAARRPVASKAPEKQPQQTLPYNHRYNLPSGATGAEEQGEHTPATKRQQKSQAGTTTTQELRQPGFRDNSLAGQTQKNTGSNNHASVTAPGADQLAQKETPGEKPEIQAVPPTAANNGNTGTTATPVIPLKENYTATTLSRQEKAPEPEDRENTDNGDTEEQEPGEAEVIAPIPAATTTLLPASKIRITDEQGKPVLSAKDRNNISLPPDPGRDYLKQQNPDEVGKSGDQPQVTARTKRNAGNRFEGGLKMGYETGVLSYTARKFTLAAYLQYNINSRLGIILQPAIKTATTSSAYTRDKGNYFQITDMRDSLFLTKDSSNYYAYRQTFDSFIIRQMAERRYAELDLPLMLKYQLDKHIAISAGFNVTLGRIINLHTETQTIKDLVLRDTVSSFVWDTVKPRPSPEFAHPGSVPYSSYVPPVADDGGSPVRLGYTLGVTYTFRDRFQVDFMVQKSTGRLSEVPDARIRQLYTQHYFRLMFGYKLFGPKQKTRKPE